MAAGTEITHPVSVLHGEYKGLPSDSQAAARQKHDVKDSGDSFSSGKGKREVEVGKPPLPSGGSFGGEAHISILHQSEMADYVMKSLDPISPSVASKLDYVPVIRSGGWADIGCRRQMEDTHVIVDDLVCPSVKGYTGAYYGVFDGHSGKDAAIFVRDNLLRYIIEDASFPTELEKAVEQAFLRTDQAFAEACRANDGLSSGTTALTALISGRTLLVANAGDCRAVLCKRGKAVDMSRDHKACSSVEKRRIEASGGFVDKCGYLNGELTVARALGNWHIEGLKGDGVDGPLSALPEMQLVTLTEEDEFLILGCDGLWDVFSSQNAVDIARKQLLEHNDPERCSKELVDQALRRDTSDNLTVVLICFQKISPRSSCDVTSVVKRSISVEGLRSLTVALQHAIEGCI